MNSCVNSVLWRISWNHCWIPGNEFTYEIMVEFIDLKLFLIRFRICFSEGKCFTHPQQSPLLFSCQLTASPKAAVWLLLSGYQAALLQLQTLGAAQCAQQSREDMEGLVNKWWTSLVSRSAESARQQEREFEKPSSWKTIKGINLKDRIQTEQKDLQKAFKQEKAKDSNTMHEFTYEISSRIHIWIWFQGSRWLGARLQKKTYGTFKVWFLHIHKFKSLAVAAEVAALGTCQSYDLGLAANLTWSCRPGFTVICRQLAL